MRRINLLYTLFYATLFTLFLTSSAWSQFPPDSLKNSKSFDPKKLYITVHMENQTLYLLKNQNVIKKYPISTSKHGAGSQKGSNKTPLGLHKIYKKFGQHAPLGTIFKSGINTRRIASIYTSPIDTEEDFVTTRILWLDGKEKGLNKGGNVDSQSRRIYIHGTPEEGLIGQPASHGCIRMKNKDVVDLFNRVKVGTLVYISE